MPTTSSLTQELGGVTPDLFIRILEDLLVRYVPYGDGNSHVPHLLEFSTGFDVSQFSRFMQVTTVTPVEPEHPGSLGDNAFPHKQSYAPFNASLGWYDVTSPAKLPESYSAVLIDGPRGDLGRRGVLKYHHVLNKGVPIYVDDVHREHEFGLLLDLADILCREYEVVQTDSIWFGVLPPEVI